mmetsp:Transcript_55633/g.118475  ORF Transcript_55633/g.118475 Transcript_55633/m.118475 type:complete len:174 (+) Transcript_55633:97-618(+)
MLREHPEHGLMSEPTLRGTESSSMLLMPTSPDARSARNTSNFEHELKQSAWPPIIDAQQLHGGVEAFQVTTRRRPELLPAPKLWKRKPGVVAPAPPDSATKRLLPMRAVDDDEEDGRPPGLRGPPRCREDCPVMTAPSLLQRAAPLTLDLLLVLAWALVVRRISLPDIPRLPL